MMEHLLIHSCILLARQERLWLLPLFAPAHINHPYLLLCSCPYILLFASPVRVCTLLLILYNRLVVQVMHVNAQYMYISTVQY